MKDTPTVVFSLPLFIEMGKKKKKRYHFNLNNYRNWCYQVSNLLKKEYKERVAEELLFLNKKNLKLNEVDLVFTLYRGDNRKCDRSNILSIHEKFFCDALVELGVLPDDNNKHIHSSIYQSGSIDRLNPRVEIAVKSLTETKKESD